MVVLISITRGHIDFIFNGKEGRIWGEAFLPGNGSPGFVIYENSFEKWNPPHDNESIDPNEIKIIIAEIVEAIKDTGGTVEVE